LGPGNRDRGTFSCGKKKASKEGWFGNSRKGDGRKEGTIPLPQKRLTVPRGGGGRGVFTVKKKIYFVGS